MALTDLSSSQLQRLIQLVKEKESIQAKLSEINRSLENLEGGKATPTEPTAKRGQRRRGKLKDGLLKKLQAAGKEGLTVKELAASLKAKPESVAIWFYTTGKKVKGIKKVGIARFAYNAA